MTDELGRVDPAASNTILVVEDELPVRELIARVLSMEGFTVVEAPDALAAVARAAEAPPDLVLLDVNLPGANGFDVLAHFRRVGDVPVIMLTGAGTEEDRITGLREGADDYVVKPFSPGELVARIHSVLRRTRRVIEPLVVAQVFDGLVVDPRTREVRVAGELVELTAREFDLLAFLVASPRQVFSREQLLQNVWSSSSDWQDSATVTEHVRRVRRKIEADPDSPRWVHTVRGVGYRFEP